MSVRIRTFDGSAVIHDGENFVVRLEDSRANEPTLHGAAFIPGEELERMSKVSVMEYLARDIGAVLNSFTSRRENRPEIGTQAVDPGGRIGQVYAVDRDTGMVRIGASDAPWVPWAECRYV